MNKEKMYVVIAMLGGTDLVISAIFPTQLEAEAWITNHHLYKSGCPLFIMEMTKYQKAKD